MDPISSTAAEQGALNTTATYESDGTEELVLNGAVLGLQDERRKLVTRILFLPGVTVIGRFAFSGCTSLSSLILPDGITEVGQFVFWGCTSLSSLLLPGGLTGYRIGYGAFAGCTILEQRSSSAGHPSVEAYMRFLSSRSRANRRCAVLASSLMRLRDELYARQAERARHQADADAVEEEEDEEEDEVLEVQAGVLNGALAFAIIHSDDLWRHVLEFV